jgi:flagellar operon protein
MNQFDCLARTNALKEAAKSGSKVIETGERSFLDVLSATTDNSTEGLKFSKHANIRLSERNIDLSAEQLDRLTEGTEKARAKGINESLIVIDNLAFIVNVKNSTVVTAVGEDDNKTFTNIDGAVFN